MNGGHRGVGRHDPTVRVRNALLADRQLERGEAELVLAYYLALRIAPGPRGTAD
jgi:hypothetical protein